MTTSDNKYAGPLITSGFKKLIMAGFILGLLAGIVAIVIPLDPGLFDGLYAVTVVTLVVLLWLFFRKEQDHWQNLLHAQPSTAIGQALGLSVFGVLLAMIIMTSLFLLIPYLFGIADWLAFQGQVGNAFGASRLFLLVGVTASVAAVSLYMLKK